MKSVLKFAGITLAVALVACGGEAPTGAVGAANAQADTSRNWAEVVAETPEGGFVMGNPDAPVKVVEYASFTCSHCADFSQAAFEPLTEEYVSRGLVSFEIRNFVRDPFDASAAILSRCNGVEPYFQITERLFANQEAMIAAVQSADQAALQQVASLPPEQRFGRMAEAAGLVDFVGGLGIPAPRAQQCLADVAAVEEIERVNSAAIEQHGLTGTPTFLINGEVDRTVYDWPTLKARLDALIQ